MRSLATILARSTGTMPCGLYFHWVMALGVIGRSGVAALIALASLVAPLAMAMTALEVRRGASEFVWGMPIRLAKLTF